LLICRGPKVAINQVLIDDRRPVVAFDSFETSSQSRRSIYPVWLRFFTFIAALVAGIILVGPTFLFSDTDPSLPWNEENRILPPDQTPVISPSPEQPQLTRVLRYKTSVRQENGSAGDISILIYPEGTVRGVWNGEYETQNNVRCQIMAASFTGNIDPSKTFIENDKIDPSRLYFITVGSFTMMETLPSGANHCVYGGIYVRGWLDSEFTASGELIVTKNKRSYKIFNWTAFPVN